jgi:hypothetical protein
MTVRIRGMLKVFALRVVCGGELGSAHAAPCIVRGAAVSRLMTANALAHASRA